MVKPKRKRPGDTDHPEHSLVAEEIGLVGKIIKVSKKISHKRRLDASQTALRVVEQAIGGKLIETKPVKRR